MDYATGYGSFSIRKEKMAELQDQGNEQLKEHFLSIADKFNDYLNISVWQDCHKETLVDVEHENGHYHGDEVEQFLEEVSSYLEGEICFTGEDGTRWRFVVKNGTVNEEGGEVYYTGDLEKAAGNLIAMPGMADTLQRVHDFLRENEQYGDSWGRECYALEYLIRLIGKAEV